MRGDLWVIETGGVFERWAYLIIKTMVSVLHKELEYKAEKLKIKKVGGH